MFVIFSVFIFIFGLIIGSFLNCLIWRIYKEETLGGRSYCPKCRKQIAWHDNIPLLSFVMLGGRCRHCHKSISWQYPLVELITALLFWLTFRTVMLQSLSPYLLVRDWLIITTLIIIFVYDLRWQLIPMNVLWPMTAIIFVFNILVGLDWRMSLIYGVLFAGFFALQYFLTKKKGLGEGDIWLGLFLGLAFPNAYQLLLVILVAYCLGSFTGLVLMVKKKKGWRSKMALGPFLAFGAIITLIWSEPVINWYLGLILGGN